MHGPPSKWLLTPGLGEGQVEGGMREGQVKGEVRARWRWGEGQVKGGVRAR